MNNFFFCILLLSVFGCTKDKTFSNKYFNLSVPTEFTIDSINLGEYSKTKFPGRELILEKDSDSYLFSFYLNNKNFEENKGITISNTVIENNTKKNVNEIALRELEEQRKYFSQKGDEKFEIVVPLKDTIIKNQKYFYYIYQYNNSSKSDAFKIQKGRLFTTINEKIHDIDLQFNSKSKSSIQDKFHELLAIISTITFKRH